MKGNFVMINGQGMAINSTEATEARYGAQSISSFMKNDDLNARCWEANSGEVSRGERVWKDTEVVLVGKQ